MASPPIFEGTLEELFQRREEFVGLRLAIYAASEEGTDTPTPPTTVLNLRDLEELLLAGINSPKQHVTEQTWDYIRNEVQSRYSVKD